MVFDNLNTDRQLSGGSRQLKILTARKGLRALPFRVKIRTFGFGRRRGGANVRLTLQRIFRRSRSDVPVVKASK